MFVLNNVPDHFSLSLTDCVPHFSTDCSVSLSQCEVNFIRSDFEERKKDARQTCSLQNKKIKKEEKYDTFNDLCFLMTLLFKCNDVIMAIKAAICG